MRQVFTHEPVMVDEVVGLFAPVPPGVVIDATAGGGGHAAALLAAHPDLHVLCLDRDPDAVEATTQRLARFGDRAVVRRGRFDRLAEIAAQIGVEPGSASGVLFDLGVSSPQLDRPERGFSYRADGPLDMRMDPDEGVTASDLVNTWSEADLARLFAANGEGRFARRIALAVVAARPLSSTTGLSDVVRDALPAAVRRQGGHPARRVFQALRVAVNEELEVLAEALPVAVDALASGGRCVVISYHSGEDRIVKAAFRQAETGGCVCPPGLPCRCGAVSVGQARLPGDTPALGRRGGPQPAFGERLAACLRAGPGLMAPTSAPERVRVDTAAAPVRVPRPAPTPRRATESPGVRGPRWPLRRTAALCGVIVMASLLVVVAASAYMTQGQVRLTRLQGQLTSVLGQHHDLEERVAQLSDPSTVVSQSEHHGLVAPSDVTDLNQVNTSSSATTVTTVTTATTATGHSSSASSR